MHLPLTVTRINERSGLRPLVEVYTPEAGADIFQVALFVHDHTSAGRRPAGTSGMGERRCGKTTISHAKNMCSPRAIGYPVRVPARPPESPTAETTTHFARKTAILWPLCHSTAGRTHQPRPENGGFPCPVDRSGYAWGE